MNTATLRRSTLLAVALALATVVGCATSTRHEGTGEYVDDTVITAKVKAAVISDPSLRSGEINVETYHGKVQLSGFVGTRNDIAKAVSLARAVDGVQAVYNDMRLK